MPPVADIERRIGQNKVGAQVCVLVAHKTISGFFAQVEVDAANRQVHRGQAPSSGIGFLPVNGHITNLATVGFDKLFRLHKHATTTTAWVIDLAVVRVEHRHQGFYDASRRIELPTLFALGTGKLTKEVLVNLA